MSIQDVVVYPRTGTGKEATGRLRREGLTPAVVYGLKEDPVAVATYPKAVSKVLRSEKGSNTVLNLSLDGTDETRHVMIKTVDRDPLTDRLTHIDFIRIDMEKPVRTVIPVEVTGVPKGVKLGGVLTHARHEVEVDCLPQHIPGVIRADVSDLGLDDALRVSDLPEIDGVTYQLGPKRVICVVHLPDREVDVDNEDAE